MSKSVEEQIRERIDLACDICGQIALMSRYTVAERNLEIRKEALIATHDILSIIETEVIGEDTDTSWKGMVVGEPNSPIDLVTNAAGVFGEKCYLDGQNELRQAQRDKLRSKS